MKISKLLACTAVCALLTGMSAAHADTLQEALATAYESNPELRAERAALRALDESIAQARSDYRPAITGSGQIERTNTESETAPDESVGFPGATSDFNSTDKAYTARVDQPLFRGFRTLNAAREARRRIFAGRAQLKSVEQDTLLDAVAAYMDVLRDEAVLGLNDNQVEVLDRQLEASEDRFRVGEITRTDVAQSQARLAVAESGRITAEAALTASREAYRRVIGVPPGTLEPPPPLPPLPEHVEQAVDVALAENPILNAARYQEEAARYVVSQAKGALLPEVQGFARISRFEGSSLVAVDTTVSRETTIKGVGAQISIPLYQSGAVYSQIRQAKQVRSQRMLEIAAAERLVVENVRNAWEQLRAARATIESTQASVRANEIALEGVRQEAAVGSRTTLDVLDAEQELLDARVNLVTAERDEYVAGFAVLASVGRLGARELGLDVDYYDPADHYERVDWKWIGWGTEDE